MLRPTLMVAGLAACLAAASPALAAYTCSDAVRELEANERRLDNSMRDNLDKAREQLRRGNERDCRDYVDAVFDELDQHEQQASRDRNRDSDSRYDRSSSDRSSRDRSSNDRWSDGSSGGGIGDLIERGLGALGR